MAKYNFFENYQGPRGPHLNFLTHYSRSREHRETKFDTSIHPFGRASGHSTMKNPKAATLRRAVDGISAHNKRHPKDAVSATRLATFERRLSNAA